MCLDGMSRFGQSNGIAAVQKERDIFGRKLFGNCPPDSATGACDQITLHKLVGLDLRARR
jgi:hypothetical protein